MQSDKQILLTQLVKKEDDIYLVTGVNYFPFTYGGDITKGVLVNAEDFEREDLEKYKTHDYNRLFNATTKKVTLEYFERPKPEEDLLKDRVYELEQGQANTEYILMEGGLI